MRGRSTLLLSLVFLVSPLLDAQDADDRILLLDQYFHADGYFWCVEYSAATATGARMSVITQNVVSALHQIPKLSEFSVVAFNSEPEAWSLDPVLAEDENVDDAVQWIDDLDAQGDSCVLPALLQTIEISNLSTQPTQAIFLVGAGLPMCNGMSSEETLLQVLAANTAGTPIHTVLFDASDPITRDFYLKLADRTEGVYIDATPVDVRFRRGDADGDGSVNGLADALFILNHQYVPGSAAPRCLEAVDVDDNGVFHPLGDAFYLLQFQFVPSAPPPPPPGPTECGSDAGDFLGCDQHLGCP